MAESSSERSASRYRLAAKTLDHVRSVLLDRLADEVISHADDLDDAQHFLLTDIVEVQGTRLQLICMVIGQLEQASANLEASDSESSNG
jgi:hypothetical protein